MAMSWLPFTERRRGLIGLVGRTIDSNAEDGMAGRIGGRVGCNEGSNRVVSWKNDKFQPI